MSRMQILRFLALSALPLWLSASLVSAGPGPNKLPRETTDVFKMFKGIPYVVAVRDVNPDPMFKCLTGPRLEFDEEVPSATYAWLMPAAQNEEQKRVVYEYLPLNGSDTVRAIVNSDTSNAILVRFPYTDYASCGILEQDYLGYHCSLWVLDEYKDSISPECLRQYDDICGESVSLYEKELCEMETAKCIFCD